MSVDSPGSGFAPTVWSEAACIGGAELNVDFTRMTGCAANLVLSPTMTIENGVARCGAGCTALPCSHWPHYVDYSAKQERLSDADVERIARRVVALLKEQSSP